MRFALGEGQAKETACLLGRDGVSHDRATCQGNVYKQAITGPGRDGVKCSYDLDFML